MGLRPVTVGETHLPVGLGGREGFVHGRSAQVRNGGTRGLRVMSIKSVCPCSGAG